jgi:hypothetical protein
MYALSFCRASSWCGGVREAKAPGMNKGLENYDGRKAAAENSKRVHAANLERKRQRPDTEKVQHNIDRTGAQWNYHSLVTLKRQVLSRILHYDTLYRQIIDVPGVICEFGVHGGG